MNKSQLIIVFLVVGTDSAHYHVTMSTQVLRNRVHHNISTQGKWILQIRGGESIIDDQDQF